MLLMPLSPVLLSLSCSTTVLSLTFYCCHCAACCAALTVQIPRFAFEKFPGSEPFLTTQMKSVGEAMAIGRTFQESFQKALRSLETGHTGWGCEKVLQTSLLLERVHSRQYP